MDQKENTPKIAFIKARWHADIVDRCEVGFRTRAKDFGWSDADVTTYEMPGAYDIPLLALKLAQSGNYDAIVASAFVVDGGIYHHEFVSATVVEALMKVQLETGTPVLSAVLTPHNFQESPAHIEFFTQHFVTKGHEAADACAAIVMAHRDARAAYRPKIAAE